MVTVPTKSQFNLMRGATSLVAACGVEEGGTLVMVDDSGDCVTVPPSKITGSRPFTLGKKPSSRGFVPTSLYGVNPSVRLYSLNGRCVAPRAGDAYLSKPTRFASQGGLFLVGDTNFVSLLKEDKRDIVDRKSAVALMKESNLRNCWPL